MPKKILILGVTGMLGSTVYRYLSSMDDDLDVYGTYRRGRPFFAKDCISKYERLFQVDVMVQGQLSCVMSELRPDIVINCIGLVKQLNLDSQILSAIEINALLPHLILRICDDLNARLIHFSTDCVFTGKKGMYVEEDAHDAQDIYGVSKYLGEVNFSSRAITLRTSLIGHEYGAGHSLLNWFLSQNEFILGYEKVIFSGLPVIEIAHILQKYVIPNPELHGLYHLSAHPISKFKLLQLISSVYKKNIYIKPDDNYVIDRSLDSNKFQKNTGYRPRSWELLIEDMHKENRERSQDYDFKK